MLLPTKNAGISFRHIAVTYGSAVALQDLTLVLEPGELYAVIGPNGGGKSTFLKALTGMVRLQTGLIEDPYHMREHMAYLPQQNSLDRHFPISVYDTVAMGLWKEIGAFKAYPPNAGARIMEALKDVGMEGYANRPLAALSGGQMQRVLFARLSLQDAGLILLDEPFNNLDQPTIEDLITYILKWHREGKTILTVLHDLDLVREYFPKSILLARELIAFGPTEEVMTVDNVSASYARVRQWSALND